MRFANKEKVQTLINSKNAMLVDMRSPVQFRDSPVPGAVNLPLRNLTNTLITIKDKKRPVILFGEHTDVKMGITYAENLSFENIYITNAGEWNEQAKKR